MLNLLVVDDEPLILAGLSAIIRNANTPFQRIETANDAIEALEKLQSFQPHLIITDIHMPEMSGLEFIKLVKESNLCHQFVILTGYDDFSYARQALRYQVLDYLLKPVDKEELLVILEDAARTIEMETEPLTAKAKTDEVTQVFTGLLNSCTYTEQMNKTLEYIHRHYAQDLSLEQVAKHIGLSPSYVSAMFKKESGMNFIPYLHTCRVVKAQQLMNEQPKLPVDKVALQVGYENPRHFFKVFKKYSGLTPGQYRDCESDLWENGKPKE
ncbi:response regulator [Paenibacillus sp. 2TAB26]|uniref:response regulator transcription factor n=1 Tax=Paenibacillus sp. 2TAB26 TaxID=3233005 RepID=UPI003F99A6CA